MWKVWEGAEQEGEGRGEGERGASERSEAVHTSIFLVLSHHRHNTVFLIKNIFHIFVFNLRYRFWTNVIGCLSGGLYSDTHLSVSVSSVLDYSDILCRHVAQFPFFL